MHGNFTGEVVSDVCQRPEGIRVKHQVKANSVKMYDKCERERVAHRDYHQRPRDFKVFRPLEGNPAGEKAWRPLVRGIANMSRLAALTQSSAERYLNALATLATDAPISTVVDQVCHVVHWERRRVRALRPSAKDDRLLLKSTSRGEFTVGGLRNRDLLPLVFPEASSQSAEQRRRFSELVTRKLRILRAHGYHSQSDRNASVSAYQRWSADGDGHSQVPRGLSGTTGESVRLKIFAKTEDLRAS